MKNTETSERKDLLRYGIAFDLGSTTLAGYLCSPDPGKSETLCGVVPEAAGAYGPGILRTIGRPNPQIPYGSDILSRVTYASKGETEKAALRDVLGDEVISMTAALLRGEDTAVGQPDGVALLERILLVGNPVILGSVRDYPFEERIRAIIPKDASVRVSSDFRAEFLPPIGNYVGADALAASYALNLERGDRTLLLVDIGTNAEIVLLRNDGHLATSVAAGPAMEGGNISSGMRGEPGAVDRVSLTKSVSSDSDLIFHTIGEKEPKGLCGSGILSLLQILLRTGAIDNTGYLRDRQAALSEGCPFRIAGRLEIDNTGYSDADNGRYFRLTDSVKIAQQDIRELLLSIAALRAGMESLLRIAGLTASELDGICLAGAFGNYITIDSAQSLGILPPISSDKVRQCGNLAGSGAVRILLGELSGDEITDVISLKNSILTVQLANRPEFQELFYRYMTLPA